MWTEAPSLSSLRVPLSKLRLSFVVSEDAEEDCNPAEGLPREGRRDVHNAAPDAVLSAALRPSGKAETRASTGAGGYDVAFFTSLSSPPFNHTHVSRWSCLPAGTRLH